MATNDFLQVGGSATAILTQSQWSALTQRTNGWSAGVLLPEHYNKALRQSGTMSAMIGEFIKTVGVLDALDDGNLASLLANYVASLKTMVAGLQASDPSSFKVVTSAPVTAPPGSPVAGDEVPVADNPTGGFAGRARKLARYNGSGWDFQSVRIGRVIRVTGTDTYWTLDASAGWRTFTIPVALVSGLQAALDSKADNPHGHVISQVADLQATLDAKLATVGGTLTGDVALNNAVAIKFKNNAGEWAIGSAGSLLVKDSLNTLLVDNYEGDTVFRRGSFAETLRLGTSGQVGFGGANYGDSSKVLTGNAGGPPAWQNITQLTPILRYDLVTASGAASWHPSATGAWVSVGLNMLLTNDIPSSWASGGAITLPAGTYDFEGRLAMIAAPGTFWGVQLRNTTDNVVLGQSGTGFANGYETQTEHLASGRFTLAASKTLVLEVYAASASTGNWRNHAAASSTAQIASLKLTKVA